MELVKQGRWDEKPWAKSWTVLFHSTDCNMFLWVWQLRWMKSWLLPLATPGGPIGNQVGHLQTISRVTYWILNARTCHFPNSWGQKEHPQQEPLWGPACRQGYRNIWSSESPTFESGWWLANNKQNYGGAKERWFCFNMIARIKGQKSAQKNLSELTVVPVAFWSTFLKERHCW